MRQHRPGGTIPPKPPLVTGGLTVADNVELPALLAGTPARQARKRREELLAELGLADKATAAPARLSGGEQQRVALARALANQPSLLLADEPTGNLDSSNARDVLRLLRRTHASGQAILMVTHDARVASLANLLTATAVGLRDHLHEVGVLKAMELTPRQVMATLVVNTTILTAIGMASGTIAGLVIAPRLKILAVALAVAAAAALFLAVALDVAAAAALFLARRTTRISASAHLRSPASPSRPHPHPPLLRNP